MRGLLDRSALGDLVALYCRGCDRRDFALVRSLYHDDAIDDHGTLFHGGPDELVQWLPGVMDRWEVTVHSISNSLFAIEGDMAQGEHHVVAYHRSLPPRRREYIVHGRYLDRYSRRGGIWKFSHRSLVFDHGMIREGDGAALAKLGGDAPWGTAGPDDPSWRMDNLVRRYHSARDTL